jgi:hypothetical protein
MATTANIANSEVNKVNTTAPAAVSTLSVSKSRRLLLIAGGACGVSGAVLALVTNGLHPHPSDFRLETLLQQIAQNATWSVLHLALIFSLMLILGALLVITLTTEGEAGATVARFAWLATLLGGALILVSTAVDGFSMNQIARSWYDAAPGEKTTVLSIADSVESAQYAIYSLSVVIFLGIGIFLYGLATTLGNDYPKALGWLAMLSGAGAFLVGVAQTLGGPTFRDTEIFFVLFSMLSTLWVFVMGLLMWRKGRGEQAKRSYPDREEAPR